ncbi:hypothetical protein ACF3MZ_13395 [Paenibacillaceae bacterium WGS1546]|uniref:hypothetical protein n=1 Tax=Cohnella sp. WGS1546 TaxID=3366810 RepID=UPI00372D7303
MNVVAKRSFEVVPTPESTAPIPSAPRNPVEDLWHITLLYGKHPSYSKLTYAVRFQTKLIGGDSSTYLFIELTDRFEEILSDLNVYGVMSRNQLMKTIDYVTQLKIKGIFTEVSQLLDAIQQDAEGDESHELFQTVASTVIDEVELYPMVTSDDYTNASPGVILNSNGYIQKFGRDVVALSSETLYDLLGLENNHQNAKRLQEIARAWSRSGYLIKRNGQSRLQEQVRPKASSNEVKRFYLLKIEGLLERLAPLSEQEADHADA